LGGHAVTPVSSLSHRQKLRDTAGSGRRLRENRDSVPLATEARQEGRCGGGGAQFGPDRVQSTFPRAPPDANHFPTGGHKAGFADPFGRPTRTMWA
jgi:hypothetical protein